MQKLITIALLCLCTITAFAAAPETRPSRHHEVYFEGTDYELNVYTILGRRDGNTLLILGGIQGDEPGGYLSADLYSSLKLDQGNLIVIPRANLKSVIMYNRGPDNDMNRLFVDDLPNAGMDYQVVKVLIQYMEQADLFLNLHDGWGFHSSTYVNEQRNPKRFGQSLIVDEDIFVCDDGTGLELTSMAMTVLEGI